MDMSKTVVGLFDQPEVAHAAVDDLLKAGIPDKQISVITTAPQEVEEDGNLAAESAATGATAGGIVGGTLGVLAGIGLLVMPVGFMIVGPLAGLLAGTAAGAVGGGVLGGLMGLGMPDEHAHAYAESIRQGGTVVTVHVSDETSIAVEEILDRDGAVHVASRVDALKKHGWTEFRHEEDVLEHKWQDVKNHQESPAEYEEETMEAERAKVARYAK
jgi:uncharacterized membrane protein